MISVRKLSHAVALAEYRSFRKAADALNLTQPALTRSIQSLEKALDARLFDRSHRAVELTVYGKIVIDRARGILTEISDLEDEVDRASGLQTGSLKVSFGAYPSALSGQRAVAAFLTAHPEIQCRVRVANFTDVADDVEQGRFELGIADLEVPTERGLGTELLVDRQAYLVGRPDHPLVEKGRCSLDDVLDHPWASNRFTVRANRHLPENVQKAGHWDPSTGEFAPALEVDVMPGFLELVEKSNILVAATLTMAEHELREGKLAIVPFVEPWFGLHYGFIFRPNHTLSPAAIRFMEIVRDFERELAEREDHLRGLYL